MCGFVGFYNLQRQEFSCSEKLLHEMNEKIKHRGPDAAGLLSLPEHGLGLAARRLSIIDLSAASFSLSRDFFLVLSRRLPSDIYCLVLADSHSATIASSL